MSAHPVRWQAPQPLWARFGATAAAAATAEDQSRPAILRFATDEFMPQVLGTLARDPARIDQLVARPETWRSPAAEPVVDLLERTPVPRLAQVASRLTLGRASRPAVAATAAEAQLADGARTVLRPLKLYQPAHQRFYLVSASLVCAVPGLPERAVVPGDAEQLNFVIRRLLPDTPGDTSGTRHEYAMVKDDQGARWQRVTAEADAAQLAANEELLAVFPLAFQDEGGRTRKLWTGLIPVGKREEYMAAAVERTPAPSLAVAQQLAVRPTATPAPKPSKQARLTQFQMEVAEPWKNLIRAAYSTVSALNEPPATGSGATNPQKRDQVFSFALKQQHPSWLVLLDFADFLDTHLHDVWAAIDGTGSVPPVGDKKTLFDMLGSATMSATLINALTSPSTNVAARAPAPSLRSALLGIRAPGVREKLEAMELAYAPNAASLTNAGWPPFHFVLAGIGTTVPPTGIHSAEGPFAAFASLPSAAASEVPPEPATESVALGTVEEATSWLDRLTALVGRALDKDGDATAPPLPFAVQMRNALMSTIDDPGWFVVRFVYTRRDCGPLHPPLLSAPTQRFQLASFFDPDAPARPIRITLPLDTSPAGLRKFSKNTAFVVSDMLCGQMQRAKGMGLVDLVRAVLPWPLHKDLDVGQGGPCNGGGFNIGMICSLSIPIITLCALIMLMIIVSLLDLIFRWLPFFAICFPVINFKAKKGTS